VAESDRDILIALKRDMEHVTEMLEALGKGQARNDERIQTLVLQQQRQESQISMLDAEHKRQSLLLDKLAESTANTARTAEAVVTRMENNEVQSRKLEGAVLGAGGVLDRLSALERSGSPVAQGADKKASEALEQNKKTIWTVTGAVSLIGMATAVFEFYMSYFHK